MSVPQQKDLLTNRWSNVRERASEMQLQISLVAHCRWRLKRGVVYFHVPNGGWRLKTEAAKLKAMGTLPGVADLMFIWSDVPLRPHVLFLELKARGRKPTAAQNVFAGQIRQAGGFYEWADSIDDSLALLNQYNLLAR